MDINELCDQQEAINNRLTLSLQYYQAQLQNMMHESEELNRAQGQLATRKENHPSLCVLVLKFVALDAITNCDISHTAFDSEEIGASGSGLSQHKRKKLQPQKEDRHENYDQLNSSKRTDTSCCLAFEVKGRVLPKLEQASAIKPLTA